MQHGNSYMIGTELESRRKHTWIVNLNSAGTSGEFSPTAFCLRPLATVSDLGLCIFNMSDHPPLKNKALSLAKRNIWLWRSFWSPPTHLLLILQHLILIHPVSKCLYYLQKNVYIEPAQRKLFWVKVWRQILSLPECGVFLITSPLDYHHLQI